ncbi:MAG: RluA family pseudouridine synthase [Rhodocyclaceae bacterium]
MPQTCASICNVKELSKDPAVRREVIGEEAASQRVDNYLVRRCKGVPKSHLYRILRSGEVRVNGRRVGPDYRLQDGDEVRIPPLRLAQRLAEPAPRATRQFEILYEDEGIVVLNKPSGVAVHGGSGISFGVIEQIRQQRPQARFLELVHRLDLETSGCLLIAKKRAVLTALQEQFRGGVVGKKYFALVRGRWPDPVRHVKLSLHKYLTPEGERRVSVSDTGKPSHSIVRLQARWQGFSLVEVELKTGRTHQIRVHLSHLGFPLCGDDKYGDFALNKNLGVRGLKRMFLHAARVGFDNPLNKEVVEISAPLPGDLHAFLRYLDRNEVRDYGATV